MTLEQSIASQVISEIEGCKNTVSELTSIADALGVTYKEVLAVKSSFDEGYDYTAIKYVFDQYCTYEKLNNDAPILAEFFKLFPSLLNVLKPQLKTADCHHSQKGDNQKSFRRITTSILSNIYSLTDNHQSVASLSTFLNVKYDYIDQIRQFNAKNGLDFETAKYIMDKWFSQRLRTKATPSISEFFIELEPSVMKYIHAMNLTNLGATKSHLSIFCGLTAKDALVVRKSCGIGTVSYDCSEAHEPDALYEYIEEIYANRTAEQLRGNFNNIMIELCKGLDAGLPLQGFEKQVKGNYNATFSHLLKLLEYNVTYGSPVTTNGRTTATGILCRIIGELYHAQGQYFGEADEFANNYELVAINNEQRT